MSTLNVDHLKKEAWRLRKERGIKHMAALHEIARREGFTTWENLLRSSKAVEPEEALQSRQILEIRCRAFGISTRTTNKIVATYGCSEETAQRYVDLCDEGYPRYQAQLMAGLIDPPDDGGGE